MFGVSAGGFLTVRNQSFPSGTTTTIDIFTNPVVLGVTKISNTLRIYIDGVFVTSISSLDFTTLGVIEFSDEQSTNYFNFRDLIIYDRELTATEHLGLFNEIYV